VFKKHLLPGDFPRHPKTAGPDNKKTVKKHTLNTVSGNIRFHQLTSYKLQGNT